MRTKVQRWGNSLAVRIPKPFAEEAGLHDSTEVEMSLAEGGLQVRAIRPRWTLRALVKRISPRNVHAEIETGPSVGKEIW
jgi:antitoxin MazE